VIVPTPIGNLGDLSLRQYEALTTSDIIACEDTRKTGKLIELIKQRRMKDKFQREFGATIDEFMDEKEDKTKQAEESEIVREVDEAGDEEMLERLLKVNEAIEKIESNGEMAAVKNPDEVVRQKVAEVLRKLEAEIVMNKFDDVLTKE
jgi:hypothetical protein